MTPFSAISRSMLSVLILAFVPFFLCGWVCAESESPTAQEGNIPAGKGEPSQEATVPANPVVPEKPEVNPLETLQRILGGMKFSAGRIKAIDPSEPTRATQKQVVQDLNDLIELLESQQNSSPPPPPSESPPPSDANEEPMPGNQPQAQPQNSSGQQQPRPVKPMANEGPSRESTERDPSTPKPTTPPSAAGQALYEKEVWGHLPPAMRRELLNVYSEKYIPQYESLIRRYYEALAEGNRRRTERP